MSKPVPAHGHVTQTKDHPVQNHCFACGRDNADGLQLEFFFEVEAHRAFCRFTLSRKYQGPPGHAHGGIIATILDEAMGKVNKLRNVLALTKSMNVEYLKPVPLGKELIVNAGEKHVVGREHTNFAELLNGEGQVLARSTGVFVVVDVKKKFAEHLEISD